MRQNLKQIGEQDRHTFTATFVRFGTKRGFRGREVKTILLSNVQFFDNEVTDHLWFTCGKQFEELNLVPGDTIEFDARVSSYIKGYRGYREDVWDKSISKDWRLSFPTSVHKTIENNEDASLWEGI